MEQNLDTVDTVLRLKKPHATISIDATDPITKPNFLELGPKEKEIMEAIWDGANCKIHQYLESSGHIFKEIKDSDGNNVLHVALMQRKNYSTKLFFEILKVAIDCLNTTNQNMETPLHIGLKNGNLQVGSNSDCWLKDLLTNPYGSPNVNILDREGRSPLQLAVEKKCTGCISLLLDSGAELDFFISKMNHSISTEISNKVATDGNNFCVASSSCFKVSYDFRPILPYSTADVSPKRELTILEQFARNHNDGGIARHIFSHPLVETLLYLKWRRARWVFHAALIISVLIASLYTGYILTVYLTNCPYSMRKNHTQTNCNTDGNKSEERVCVKCDEGYGALPYSLVLMLITTFDVAIRCCMIYRKMGALRKTFSAGSCSVFLFHHWFSVAEILLKFLIFFSVWPVAWSREHRLKGWQYAIAAYGLFSEWASLLAQVRRYPNLGVYVDMVGKVLLKFAYLMSAYIFILVGFAVSFVVVFPTYAPFLSVMRAVLKVITMMSGEVDYVEFFYPDTSKDDGGNGIAHNRVGEILWKSESTTEDHGLFHPLTAHILYGAFVISCTIVLMNLLNGLAVDEIKELRKDAQLTRNMKQLEEISNLESILGSKYLRRFVPCNCFKSLLSWMQQKLSVIDFSKDPVHKGDRWIYVMCPVHTSDNCFPKLSTYKDFDVKRKNSNMFPLTLR